MSYKSYWDARAKACEQFADEGECLAQVARHVPVTLGDVGGLGRMMARGAPRRREPGSRGYRTGSVNMGEMARRARRAARQRAREEGRGGGGGRRMGARGRGREFFTGRYATSGLSGLGASAQEVLQTVASVVADPEGTLARRGPAIVSAADRHIVNPMIDKATAGIMPYILKYIVPLMVVGYVGTGIAAFYSYKSAKKLNANRRRRRRTSR